MSGTVNQASPVNSALNRNWRTGKLRDVCSINPKRVVPSASASSLVAFIPMAAVQQEFGGIDVSATRPLSEVQKGYTQFQAGDVLFAKITPCMENGKVAIVPELPSACGYGSTEFHVLRPSTDIDPRWIAYYISQEGVRRDAQRNMTGSAGQLRVPTLWLQDFTLPIPDVDEQRVALAKIEELFSDLDAGVAALRRAQANLKRYRASVLKAAVEGRLTEKWRAEHPATEPADKLLERILAERRKKWEAAQLKKFADAGKPPPKGWQNKYPEPVAPAISSLSGLPNGWCVLTIDQLADVGTGTTPLRGEQKYWKDGTIPWVTSAAVNADLVTEASDHVTREALEQTTLKMYPTHTLILAMYGEGKTRGKVAELLIDATINQALAALQLNGEAVQARSYLKLFLQGNYEQMRRLSAGGVQPNLNLGLVQRICLPLPPAAEQGEIIAQVEATLSSIAQAESEIDHSLARATRLRQAILKRAFEGRLV